jgi:diguanylate cyclase (GGDEF)-like protein/PAS domain S-box-containing protein
MMKISGIKQQTMLVALIPILLMTMLFEIYSIFARFDDADHALLEYSKSTLQHLASSSEYALFSGNIASLKQGVNATLKQPDINSVLVLDTGSKPLIAESREMNAQASLINLVNASSPIYQDNNVLILYEPILSTQLNLHDFDEGVTVKDAIPLGAVAIEFSKSQLNQQKTEMLLINLLVMIGVLIISVMAALWLARRISNPILSMGVIIHKIGSGNLGVRIPAQPAVHELNELAHNINNMAQQLEDDRGTLEQRIHSATGSLREKKEEAEQAHQEVLSLNEKLSFALNELETIIEANPDLLYVMNTQGQLIKWNSNLEKFSGLSKEQVMNRDALEFFCDEDQANLEEWMQKVFCTGSATVEARCVRHDGTLVPFLCNGVVLKNPAGDVIGFTGTGRDISERLAAAELLRHMAHHDKLTDLPNRALFSDRLQHALATAHREKKRMALMFIDLDRFKHINDTLGHNVGDLLLKEATLRMLGCVRESDTVARIGGDEFMVLLPAIEKQEYAMMVAEKIRHSLCQPLNLTGNIISISSSLGIAIFPEHGISEEELIKHADDAMYAAKQAGRNIVRLHGE